MHTLPLLHSTFPTANESLASKCDHVVKLLVKAQHQKIIDSPTTALTEFAEESGDIKKFSVLNPVRFGAIAKQLWLLGYLKEKPRKNIAPSLQESHAFQVNVSRFQRDAGLTQDGWVGEKSWRALQELVSFETRVNLVKWKRSDGAFLTAFNRAIQLRMWAYGLVKNKPAFTFAGLHKKQIEKAKQTLQHLCGKQYDDRNWLNVLLDSDAMLSYAAHSMKHESRLKKTEREELRTVLISIARIELWLLGFNIDIDNADNYRVSNLGVRRVRRYRGGRWVQVQAQSVQLKNALVQFWHTLVGMPIIDARKHAQQLTGDFYLALQSPPHASEKTTTLNEVDFSRQAIKELHTTDAINKAYSQFKRLGMKLWDGAQRLWRWLVSSGKKIVQVGSNLVRGFFRIASKGNVIIRKSFLAFSASLRQYRQGFIENTGKSALLIKKDFDFVVALHVNDSPSWAMRSITTFSTQFLLSSKLVSLIVQALSSTVHGIVGWARFLFILVKSYRELVPLYRALQSSYIAS